MDAAPPPATPDQVRLETKIGFLEHTIEALNEVVVDQGREIDSLRRRLEHLEARAAAPRAEVPEPLDPLEERPPHY